MLALAATSCAGAGASGPSPDAETALRVTVHLDDTHQTIRGFGASDAWSIQHVGTWPDPAREAIADLLFSTALDPDGRPVGIGLSIWRFNIGAGSAAQGDASGIRDPWRRAEGFLQEGGAYDWTRHAGQRWFLRAARDRGVQTFIGFVNSPPVQLTRTGTAWGDGRPAANLAPDRFDDFAAFLATVARHFADRGLPFDALSPVNEPQWDWARDSRQEGSPYTNDEIIRLARALDRHFADAGLTTRIELPEAARIDFLYEDDTDRPARDDQLEALFGDALLQDLTHVASTVAAHSYGTTWPVESMIERRKALRNAIQVIDPGLEYAMSEYCILASNREIRGRGRDLGIDPALYVARLIHFDLTLAHATSWQWWLAVSPYDYKDGLVYVEKSEDGGAYHDSKLLWALGNFSRFLRPGAVRVATSRSDGATDLDQAGGVMVSGYRAPDGAAPVVVAVNYGAEDAVLELLVEGAAGGRPVRSWRPYITSASGNLEPGDAVPAGSPVVIPARSVVTLVGDVSG